MVRTNRQEGLEYFFTPGMCTLQIKTGCAAVLLAAFLLQGCATYVNGTRQDLTITTIPPGVTATIKDQSCTTPCTLNVPRKSRYVTLQKGDFRAEYILDRKTDYRHAILGNIIFFLYPGLIIDSASGGMHEIDPVNIILENADLIAAGIPSAPEKACEPCVEIIQVQAPAPENKTAWSLGVAGYRRPGAAGTMTHINYEQAFGRRASLSVKVGYIDDRSNYGSYKDASNGIGGEVGMRFYRQDHVLEGWYMGGGLGFWSVKGDWQDDVGTPFVTTGQGNATVADLNVQTGYKWYPKQRRYFIDPSLGAGVFFPGGTPDPFGPRGGYLSAGLAIGMRW
jgi:PEGA domain